MTWTHVICTACWDKRHPGRVPVRVKDSPEEPCCFCGRITAAGIYVRHDPRELACTHLEEGRPVTGTRIRWTEDASVVPVGGPVPAWKGHVGEVRSYLFLITLRSLGGDDLALSTELPWMSKRRTYDPDPDKLRAEAERWLTEFVGSLGAVFPEDEISDDEDDEPPEVTWAAGRRVRYAHPDNGYPGERERTADCLTLGAVYTVAWADIGQSRTDLNLTTVRGSTVGHFNSVFFEPADDEDGQ